MNHPRLAATLVALSLPLFPTITSADAQEPASLRVTHRGIGEEGRLEAVLEEPDGTGAIGGTGATGFVLLVSWGSDAFDPNFFRIAGVGLPNGRGQLSLDLDVPRLKRLFTNVDVHFRAAVRVQGRWTASRDTRLLIAAAECRTLDFNTTPAGAELPAGTVAGEQWSAFGVRVAATNSVAGHPDAAIIFDSLEPSGEDFDLRTPGNGRGNDRALGNLLIVAEDLTDRNGDLLVDDPDDEEGGGEIRFSFIEPVTFCDITLVDIDPGETVQIIASNSAGNGLDGTEALPTGNNSVQEVLFTVDEVSEIRIIFSGSGGVATIGFIPPGE